LTKTTAAANVADMNGSTAQTDPSSLPLKALSVVLVIAAAFSYAFVPVRACNDVWWHLKTGQWIVEAGWHLPVNDVFTYAGGSMPWYNHEWLAQVIFYKIFQWGGGATANLIGLRLLIGFVALATAAAFLLTFILVQQRCRCAPLAALIALLALDVARYNLYPRPPAFTYLFMALFLLTLSNWKSQRWPKSTLLALPFITILWANLHGGFIVGLLLIGFYLAGEIAEHFLWRRGSAKSSPANQSIAHPNGLAGRLIWLGVTLLACLACSLCTPYHYHLYELPFRVMTSSALVKTIAELRSPFGPDVVRHFISFFVMAGLIIVGLGAVRATSRNRPPAADLVVLLFFGYEAVRHIRHLPLFGIACAPILGWAAGQLLDRTGDQVRRRVGWLATASALLFGSYCIGWRSFPETYWNRNATLAGGVTYIEINYPKDVCDLIVVNEFTGRMFNPINVSGYLIWRLSPEKHQLFTDNRFDIFGDRFVWDEFVVSHAIERDDWDRIDWPKIGLSDAEGGQVRERCQSAGWSDILDRWDVNFIVAERSWTLSRKMSGVSGWERVFTWVKPPYVDLWDGYDVFVRRTEANRELISRCKRYAEQIPLFGRVRF
jgi:hypothetical protein